MARSPLARTVRHRGNRTFATPYGSRPFLSHANRRRGKGAAPIAPLALDAVKRIDALFDIEREINGESAERRLALRRERSATLVAELEAWMRAERTRLSRHAPVAKAMEYMLKRWNGFTRFLDDGRICLTNNAAEKSTPRGRSGTTVVAVRRL